MKPLFITIDTEGDALWDNPTDIKTENVLSIPRFQELCERYQFIPIWLTDYEIISDERYVDYIKPKAKQGLCEVGIHLHARNNPPIVELEGEEEGAAFLIEYPTTVMADKFSFLKNLIEEKIEMPVISHRAGRWALDERYVGLLADQGIKYDCSVTPGVDWSNTVGIVKSNRGANYCGYSSNRQTLSKLGNEKVIEYPVSIMKCSSYIPPDNFSAKSVLKSAYHFIKHSTVWLRPNTDGNLNEMKYILKQIAKNGEFAEFMIHSSELMPGGGPRHQGEDEVNRMFDNMEKLFDYAKGLGFKGYTFEGWEKEKY